MFLFIKVLHVVCWVSKKTSLIDSLRLFVMNAGLIYLLFVLSLLSVSFT